MGCQHGRMDTMFVEKRIHIFRVVLTHAEAQRPALCDIQQNLVHLLQNKGRPLDVAVKDVVQLRFIVSAVGPPERAQIYAVADPEILERRQQFLVDGIW